MGAIFTLAAPVSMNGQSCDMLHLAVCILAHIMQLLQIHQRLRLLIHLARGRQHESEQTLLHVACWVVLSVSPPCEGLCS